MGSSWQVKQLHNRQVCRQLQLQKKGCRLPAILVIWFQFLVSAIIENFKHNCIFPPFFLPGIISPRMLKRKSWKIPFIIIFFLFQVFQMEASTPVNDMTFAAFS